MLTQVIFANLNFTVNMLGFFAFFGTGLLMVYSWGVDKDKKTYLYRGIGMFLYSTTYLFSASALNIELLIFLFKITKIIALLIILFSLYKEPLLSPPSKQNAGILIFLASQATVPLTAVLLFLVAFRYLRKFTEGYEKQLKFAFIAFLLLSLSEFTRIPFFASTTNIVNTSLLLREHGLVDNISLALGLAGEVALIIWAWGYIRFRVTLQFFILTLGRTLLIFTVGTFVFTLILFRNLEDISLAHLKTDMNVLQFAVEEMKSRSLTNAKTVSQNPTIVDSANKNDTAALYAKALEFMNSENASIMDVTDKEGVVIVRAEDNERVGDSLSEDSLVASALSGKALMDIFSKESPITPTIEIRAASPIQATDSAAIIGSVVTGYGVDSAFVDGIKAGTGLDVAVFSGDTRAATTFVTPDGKSRYIGTKESNKQVLDTVLGKGETFSGAIEILNQPFYAVYAPIKSEGKIIGMLFVGNLQTELLATVTRSVELTFVGSLIIMILSIIPAYFISKYISKQVKA